MQLVSLEESPLHGALKSIPRTPFELDPEYEVDPSQLVIMEKIGAHLTLLLLQSSVQKKRCLFASQTSAHRQDLPTSDQHVPVTAEPHCASSWERR